MIKRLRACHGEWGDRHVDAHTFRVEAALSERHRQPAVRTVVGGAHEPGVGEFDNQRLQGPFGVEIERWRHAPYEAVHELQILAASKLATVLSEEHDDVAGGLKAAGDKAV